MNVVQDGRCRLGRERERERERERGEPRAEEGEEEVPIARVEEVNAPRFVTNLSGVTQCLIFIFLQGFLFG